MTHWHVGILRTGSETAIRGLCDDIGVEVYCPMERTKGARRRGEPGREAIERPMVPGYMPIRATTVEDPETRERLYQEPAFYDFIRDINHEISEMADAALDPLRARENAAPVKFYSGPTFFMGEVVKVPFGNDDVAMAFWGMTGQVVSVKNGRYCLGGGDFTMEAWFTGCQLLKPAV